VTVAIAALLALTLAQPLDASVRPPDAKAKARAQLLLREGTKLYGRGNFQGALDKFTGAYALFPSPKLWFNIGQANRDLDRPVEALDAFEAFLKGARQPPPRIAAEAQQSIADLQARLGQLQIDSTPAGAQVTVDGRAVGETPLARALWVLPGRHEVALEKAGRLPTSAVVTIGVGALQKVALLLLPPAAPVPALPASPPPPPPPPLYARRWFWAGLGAAVVAGTVTAYALTRDPSPR
jgi:tetratricopeptide (TPR) repeat protein